MLNNYWFNVFLSAASLASLMLGIIFSLVEVDGKKKIKVSFPGAILIILAVILFSLAIVTLPWGGEAGPPSPAPTSPAEAEGSFSPGDDGQDWPDSTGGPDESAFPSDSASEHEPQPSVPPPPLDSSSSDPIGTQNPNLPLPPFNTENPGTTDSEPSCGLLSLLCSDDPLFTDYYVLLTTPDHAYPIQYNYNDFPVALPAIEGEFRVQIFRASTDLMIIDTDFQYINGRADWDISFPAPPDTFRFRVRCGDDPEFDDYYVELFEPDSTYPDRFFPEQFPVELYVQPGEYRFSVYQYSTNALLLDHMVFYAPDDNGQLLSFGFAAPESNSAYEILLDTELYSGTITCSTFLAAEGDVVSFCLDSDCEFSVSVTEYDGYPAGIPVSIWNGFEYGLTSFYFYMPDSDVLISVRDY